MFLLVLGIISYEAVNLGYGRKMATLTRSEASDAMKVSVTHDVCPVKYYDHPFR